MRAPLLQSDGAFLGCDHWGACPPARTYHALNSNRNCPGQCSSHGGAGLLVLTPLEGGGGGMPLRIVKRRHFAQRFGCWLCSRVLYLVGLLGNAAGRSLLM